MAERVVWVARWLDDLGIAPCMLRVGDGFIAGYHGQLGGVVEFQVLTRVEFDRAVLAFGATPDDKHHRVVVDATTIHHGIPIRVYIGRVLYEAAA